MGSQKIRKYFFLSLGTVSFATGLLGLFLPLLPTTCFVLLSAYCFSKSSDRLYQKLISHPRFGSTILEWEKFRVIKVPIKCWASTMISLSAFILWFTSVSLVIKIGVSGFLLGLVFYIWSKPHAKPQENLQSCPMKRSQV
ncbi:MAG: YbaN family protein [Bdellovibrionales bacterium]